MQGIAMGLVAAGLFVLADTANVDAAGVPVRAWEGTESIPTYEEGPPDPNPPFDLVNGSRFNYPYTMRESLTDRRAPRSWRTLSLENEHLKVTVLPDLGGRVWRAVDKANGAQMFYANPSLKFANVAYRGAWATFGIEFNFPVSHNWVTSSPVDFALVRRPDGSASIVVGNVDLGPNAAGQAYFLRALGHEEEARVKSREALLLPDKVMSHYLSRLALVPTPPW